MHVRRRLRGAFLGLYYGAGINPRFEGMLSAVEAKERFSDAEFQDINRSYELYDQHTKAKIVYDILMEHGEITVDIFKHFLLDLHERENVFEGDVYGPSTQATVKQLLDGTELPELDITGVTCGAAMQALPVAMFFHNNVENVVTQTVRSSRISHNTDVAIGSAIACNVTLAQLLKGSGTFEAIRSGIRKCRETYGEFGEQTAWSYVHERIESAVSLARNVEQGKVHELISKHIGATWFAIETVPNAFANYVAAETPEESAMAALRCGGDEQTPVEIACAFMGAEQGPSIFDQDVLRRIEEVNDVDIFGMADRLVETVL